METLARLTRPNHTGSPTPPPAVLPRWRHSLLHITTTRPLEFIDITDRVESLVAAAAIRMGLVNVQALHTTTAIIVNEHEPLLLGDFVVTLDKAAPSGARYRHDELDVRTVNMTPNERANGHAHCKALLLGAAACLTVVDGRLLLGRWQRVFLAELDGPRERLVSVIVFGDADGRP
jgi:secondary thiamine-phosphate synthase enzyme